VSYSRVSIERFLTHAIEVNDFYGSPNPACAGRNASAAPHIADIRVGLGFGFGSGPGLGLGLGLEFGLP